MNFRRLVLPLALVGLVLAAFAHAKGSDAADKSHVRAAINKHNDEWADAQVKGDANAIVNLFAEDGMELFSRRAKVLKGRDSLLVFWKAVMLDGHPTKAAVSTVDVALNGDYATEVGTYAYTYPPDSTGKEQHDSGRYAVIWRRQADGEWKIWMDTGVPKP